MTTILRETAFPKQAIQIGLIYSYRKLTLINEDTLLTTNLFAPKIRKEFLVLKY